MNAYKEWNGWEKVGKKKIEKLQAPEHRTPHILYWTLNTEHIHNSKSVFYVWIVFMGLFEMNKMKMESKHKQNEEMKLKLETETVTETDIFEMKTENGISKSICRITGTKFNVWYKMFQWLSLVEFFGERMLFQLVSNSIEMKRSIHIVNSILHTSYLMAYGSW